MKYWLSKITFPRSKIAILYSKMTYRLSKTTFLCSKIAIPLSKMISLNKNNLFL